AAAALANAVQRKTKAFLAVLPGGMIGGPRRGPGAGPGPGGPGGPGPGGAGGRGGPPLSGPSGPGGPGGPGGWPPPGESLGDPAVSGRPAILPPNPDARGGP